MNGSPPFVTAPPPPLPSESNSVRRLLATVLSLCLALFLADALVSCADDFLILFFGLHWLSFLRGLVSLVTVIAAVGLYGLFGLTPMVPKRLFLPIPGFYLAAMLVAFPFAIFFYDRLQQFALAISACQVAVAFSVLYAARRRAEFFWPLVPVNSLDVRPFSWRNLSVFALVNICVLLPLTALYVFVCSAKAVNHFSEGFMALRPGGFTVQVRKYIRGDGKVIELFPMAHVANADFYKEVSETFPSNSVILMEGVSDSQNLLTNKITYKRMAKSLGLAEQKGTFIPEQGEIVRADVDVDQFSKETIDFLNVVMLIHSKGLDAESLFKLTEYSPPPGFEKRLFDDILRKRNQHLLQEIQSYLPQSDRIMVPWGVAHMPGIAKGIQQAGFRLSETREYTVIAFHGRGHEAGSIGH